MGKPFSLTGFFNKLAKNPSQHDLVFYTYIFVGIIPVCDAHEGANLWKNLLNFVDFDWSCAILLGPMTHN